jgi:hypothetical protein
VEIKSLVDLHYKKEEAKNKRKRMIAANEEKRK